MRKFLVIAAILIVSMSWGCSGTNTSGPQSGKPVYPQGSAKDMYLMGRQEQRYHLFIPFGSPPPGGWKLLLAIPDENQDVTKLTEYWLEAMGDKPEYIILAPYYQPGFKDFTHNDDVLTVQMIEEVKEKNQIHNHGVYIAGPGAGAEFAYRFAFQMPAVISKVACISAPRFDKPNPFAKSVQFLLLTGSVAEPQFIKAAKDFNLKLTRANFFSNYVIIPGEDDKISLTKCLKALEFFNT